MKMRAPGFALPFVLVALSTAPGCGIGSGGGASSAADPGLFGASGLSAAGIDVTGSWSFSAAHNDPPAFVTCSGSAAPVPLCGAFSAPLEQTGTGFTGSSADPYCSHTYAFTGVIAGDLLSGTYVNDGPSGVYRTTFTGIVNGSGVTLTPTSFTVDGVSGSCLLTGTYLATR